MSDGMTEMAWELQEAKEDMERAKQAKRKINDITPAEWDAMARRGRETQELYEAKQRWVEDQITKTPPKIKSDGSTASYYELPKGAAELQDLISFKNMNAQIGEIFRECYRYGQASHSDEVRGIKKILFYAQAELKRIENSHGSGK